MPSKKPSLRALLIDPDAKTVTRVEYDGNYRSISRLIENGSRPFDALDLGEGESIFFDDEFLLNDDGEPRAYFTLVGPVFTFATPIGGKGLVLGVNGEGESVGTLIDIKRLEANLRFDRRRIVGWTPGSSEKVTDHPVLGECCIIKGPAPIFEIVKD